MATMKDFSETAKYMTKNPLGVIGLFLVLVYGFASLVLGMGGAKLESQERMPLIWFLVLFPLLVLAAFYRLVTHHHKKLYAPSDFRDERLFFQPLAEAEIERKVNEEVESIEAAESKASSLEGAYAFASQTNLRARYVEAERLGFLALEEKLGLPVQKHISLQSHGRSYTFDGLLLSEKEARLIEIKYFSRPTFKREFLEAPLFRASSFLWAQMFDKNRENITFNFVIVMDFPKEHISNFTNQVQQNVGTDLFKVEFLFLHYDDLEKRYGARST